jgi:hypothetical protein
VVVENSTFGCNREISHAGVRRSFGFLWRRLALYSDTDASRHYFGIFTIWPLPVNLAAGPFC